MIVIGFGFKILFTISLIAAIFLTVVSVINREWETTTATISLIIAIISGWIAFKSFNEMEERKKPSITLSPDLTSRYNILSLKLSNLGQNPAYRIKINWIKNPISSNENASYKLFTTSEYQSYILRGNEDVFVPIDTQKNFFQEYRGKNLMFSGTISYSLTMKSSRRRKIDFEFSLDHYLSSITYENEELKTNFELQKIPQKLDELKEVILKFKKN